MQALVSGVKLPVSVTRFNRIVIADHTPIFSSGIEQALGKSNYYQVLASTHTKDVAETCRQYEPDILILASDHNETETIKTLLSQYPQLRIVLISGLTDMSYVSEMLKSGVVGFLTRFATLDTLMECTRYVSEGTPFVCPQLAIALIMVPRVAEKPMPTHERLTAREDQIYAQIARGRSNKEIARELALSEKTVKHHMTNLLHKLGARNRVEVALRYSTDNAMTA